jgi:hypothetical protein
MCYQKNAPFKKGYTCKDCKRIEYRNRRERNIRTHKKKDATYYIRHKKEIAVKRKEYNKKHKDRVYARGKVRVALLSGELMKPDSCSCCGKSMVNLDAHHEDYSKPLIVVWICRKCHQIKHNGK